MSETLHRRTSLGLQTLTVEYPLGFVVLSRFDLAIVEELFHARRVQYSVIEVSLPDLLGNNFPQLMEDEKIARGLDVFVIYDIRGDFIAKVNGDQSKFKVLH